MSMGRAMARLGYQPTTDLPKGLSAELDWLQNKNSNPRLTMPARTAPRFNQRQATRGWAISWAISRSAAFERPSGSTDGWNASDRRLLVFACCRGYCRSHRFELRSRYQGMKRQGQYVPTDLISSR